MSTSVDVPAPIPAEGNKEELFRWLGRRDAFSLMAGRCSAADVECLKRIRDGKLYLGHTKDWEEFCEKEVHMSKSNANRMIALREQLGDAYFYISQATRIPLKEYRLAIAPHVREDSLEIDGEMIPLAPENSERIAAAVATLRAAVPPTAPAPGQNETPVPEEVASLVTATDDIIARFRRLARKQGEPDRRVTTTVGMLRERLAVLLQEIS